MGFFVLTILRGRCGFMLHGWSDEVEDVKFEILGLNKLLVKVGDPIIKFFILTILRGLGQRVVWRVMTWSRCVRFAWVMKGQFKVNLYSWVPYWLSTFHISVVSLNFGFAWVDFRVNQWLGDKTDTIFWMYEVDLPRSDRFWAHLIKLPLKEKRVRLKYGFSKKVRLCKRVRLKKSLFIRKPL